MKLTTTETITVTHVGDFADRRHMRVTAHTDGSSVEFTGPTNGMGTVLVLWCGHWVTVLNPGRYGDVFDSHWLIRYFSED